MEYWHKSLIRCPPPVWLSVPASLTASSQSLMMSSTGCLWLNGSSLRWHPFLTASASLVQPNSRTSVVCILVVEITGRSNLHWYDMFVPQTRTEFSRRSFTLQLQLSGTHIASQTLISQGQFMTGLKTHHFNQIYTHRTFVLRPHWLTDLLY